MKVSKLHQGINHRLAGFFSLLVPPVYAYTTPIGDVDICGIIDTAIDFLFGLAGLIAIAFIIYGGITYVTSGGDKMGVAAARDKITAGVVGLVIALAAWFLLNFVVARVIGGMIPGCTMPW